MKRTAAEILDEAYSTDYIETKRIIDDIISDLKYES